MAARVGETQLRLIDARNDVVERRAEKRDAGYLVREMLLCTLPHRDPKSHFYRREAKDSVLLIQSGMDMQGTLYGIPFGVKPRLLMYWLVTEVKRTGNRRLELRGKNVTAASFSDFMRELGLDPSHGGKKADGASLRDAMRRLFGARIVVHHTKQTLGNLECEPSDQYLIASRQRVWWDRSDETLGAPSWVEIGDALYEAISRSVIPADMRALKALVHSSLAMDLYGLLNYFGANRHKPELLTWRELQGRLGSGYGEVRNFRIAAREALKDVLKVHPGLRAEVPEGGGGIRVYPSEPAIPRRIEVG